MPTKTVKIQGKDENGDILRDEKTGEIVMVDTGREYEINGKKFTWHPLDEDDKPGNLPDLTIPLRIKLGLIRKIGSNREMDAAAMFDILEALIPGQAEAMDEMDIVTDFQPMFETWQSEYNSLNGATPGE